MGWPLYIGCFIQSSQVALKCKYYYAHCTDKKAAQVCTTRQLHNCIQTQICMVHCTVVPKRCLGTSKLLRYSLKTQASGLYPLIQSSRMLLKNAFLLNILGFPNQPGHSASLPPCYLSQRKQLSYRDTPSPVGNLVQFTIKEGL